ncbi:hypothetical protein [Dokdonella sp.]|uniref:hypothetical protein n=1 Tax=Dokdonella sp. TaxID=2291710 RepID=UPI0037847819
MPSTPRWEAVTGRHIRVRRKSSEQVILGGQVLSDLDLWRLAGAVDETVVDVEPPRPMGGGMTHWMLDGSNVGPSGRLRSGALALARDGVFSSPSRRRLDVSDDPNVGPVLRNRGYYLSEPLQGQGIAWAALCLQVEAAHRLGIARIDVHVEADTEVDLTKRVGRLQWLRMGFDGPVPAEILRSLTATMRARLRLPEHALLSQLLVTPEGRDLWIRSPLECVLTLDLVNPTPAGRALLASARSKGTCVRTR